MAQTYAERSSQRQEVEEDSQHKQEIAAKAGATAVSAEAEVAVQDIDALLAEFDETLEKNAEEFVENFQQQGGQ